jgi:hypothetical protein
MLLWHSPPQCLLLCAHREGPSLLMRSACPEYIFPKLLPLIWDGLRARTCHLRYGSDGGSNYIARFCSGHVSMGRIDRRCSARWYRPCTRRFALVLLVCSANRLHKHLQEGFAMHKEGFSRFLLPGRYRSEDLLLELQGCVRPQNRIKLEEPTLGFSFVTLLRIFSSRRRRPGSLGPRPVRRDWSEAAAASSFSSSHISKYFLTLAKRGALIRRSSFRRRISSSWIVKSSSVNSSIGSWGHRVAFGKDKRTVSEGCKVSPLILPNHQVIPQLDDLFSGTFYKSAHSLSFEFQHPLQLLFVFPYCFLSTAFVILYESIHVGVRNTHPPPKSFKLIIHCLDMSFTSSFGVL